MSEKYDVALIELYPTHNQENTALDMVGTASCLDQLRFFYKYLWMPWDIDDDDNVDWVSEISLYGCKSEGNGKGDVILKQTTSFVLRKQDESMET